MKATTVEVVFVIDASESMRPCFEGLARNLDQVVQPLQAFNFKVRLGLVAMSLGTSDTGGRIVRTVTLAGDEAPIYRGNPDLFTEDGTTLSAKLRALELGGDEHHLIALDCALDYPFGPLATTRRVVALFSDEKIEDGMLREPDISKIPDLVTKIMARRIQFFAALPSSPALEQLATADCCQIEDVQGGDGLASINFAKLLGQMAKSISGTSLQAGAENYKKALFGQDTWSAGSGSFGGLR
jgi:hypothetical protein